ncbi:uncharacterized protein LOC124437677 isoform X2 [Xenia sp. Carnegie-2017]|uniref:uncharacterized protein LOC124437677 isoform X2 n=1 Tax=Xenia sp. Carnegie-2017 TaxID=2897299 RepID=UPI001F04D552|nr:uncharacterized protein LOC124437677 isoform X2 [Xenia sp. Carnegie-2017]
MHILQWFGSLCGLCFIAIIVESKTCPKGQYPSSYFSKDELNCQPCPLRCQDQGSDSKRCEDYCGAPTTIKSSNFTGLSTQVPISLVPKNSTKDYAFSDEVVIIAVIVPVVIIIVLLGMVCIYKHRKSMKFTNANDITMTPISKSACENDERSKMEI